MTLQELLSRMSGSTISGTAEPPNTIQPDLPMSTCIPQLTRAEEISELSNINYSPHEDYAVFGDYLRELKGHLTGVSKKFSQLSTVYLDASEYKEGSSQARIELPCTQLWFKTYRPFLEHVLRENGRDVSRLKMESLCEKDSTGKLTSTAQAMKAGLCLGAPASRDLILDIMQRTSRQSRHLCMDILSGQAFKLSPRPTGIIIGIFPNLENARLGQNEGYVVVHDLIDDRIITKRYHSCHFSNPFHRLGNTEDLLDSLEERYSGSVATVLERIKFPEWDRVLQKPNMAVAQEVGIDQTIAEYFIIYGPWENDRPSCPSGNSLLELLGQRTLLSTLLIRTDDEEPLITEVQGGDVLKATIQKVLAAWKHLETEVQSSIVADRNASEEFGQPPAEDLASEMEEIFADVSKRLKHLLDPKEES